jgi:hypothetical protein
MTGAEKTLIVLAAVCNLGWIMVAVCVVLGEVGVFSV